MMQRSHQDSSQKEMGALSKDPSKLKDVVGTTDSTAKEDVARGSGFVVGGSRLQIQSRRSGSNRGVRYGDCHDH